MMRLDLRSALGFALRFLPIFLIFLAIYLQVLPWYRAVPEGVANSLMEWMEPQTRIEALPGGGWQAYRSAGGAEAGLLRWEPFVVHLIFLNLVLLPALLLATPGPIPGRLRLAGWGIALVVLVQALSLVGLVRGHLCLATSPGGFLCLWLLRLVYASGQLSAAALWALLAWRFWVPRERLDPPPE